VATNAVEPGRYRHWKGPYYEVVGIGIHTETNEKFVVYIDCEPAADPTKYYLRPLASFLEVTEVDGQQVPRFVPAPRDG
jgi:hypothetical protein